MALLYANGQYRAGGDALTHDALVALRNAWVAAWQDELAGIAREELGAGQGEAAALVEFPPGRVNAFAARFLRRVGEMVIEAYVWAAGGVDRVTDAGWRSVADLVARQEAFGQGFVGALTAGELSSAEAAARARLYGGAGVEAFEQGRAAQVGFEPPAVPGAGDTECGTNCRCEWRIEEFPDRVEATWIAVDDEATCETCERRATAWAPLVQWR